MSTALLTQTDTSALLSMSPEETSKTVAQMTALMNAMASEKDNIDSMAAMLEKQPWYKKMWFTISGKNKATVKEIQQSKDKLTAYTANALAELYKNSRIEQAQIIAVGQAVNSVNSQLAATNYELIKTQEAFAEFKAEIIDTIGSLANALNEKIKSIDNYHSLIEEIALGKFDRENIIAIIFGIISQIDKPTAEDSRKMENIHIAMSKQGYLNDNELPITEYMNCVAKLPDNIVGTIYYEFSCLNGNDYAEMFCEVIENYSMLPKMEKKSKKLDVIINGILESHNVDSDTEFSTNEIYDYFIEGKIDYLTTIREIQIPVADYGDSCKTSIVDIECDSDTNQEGINNATESDDSKDRTNSIKTATIVVGEKINDIPEELSKISIDNIMSIPSGETKKFKYSEIHCNSMIQCCGDLVFDNCILYYNEPNASSGITLENNSSISFSNCKIVCKGISKSYFVNAEGHIFSANFENTEFVDCTGFLTGNYGCVGFNIHNCKFYNCFLGLFNVSNNKDDYIGTMDSCIFLFDNLPTYIAPSVVDNWDNLDNSCLKHYRFDSVIMLPCHINNILVYNSYKVKKSLLPLPFINTGDEGKITNSTFIGTYSYVAGAYFQKCKFINCDSSAYVNSDSTCQKAHYIENSVFSHSGPVIISCSSSLSSVAVKNCRFYNCEQSIIRGDGCGIIIEFCEFFNIDISKEKNSVLGLFDMPITAINIDYSDEKCSKITNCIFNGCNLGNNFLIGSDSTHGKLKGYAISVEKCSFRNIKTTRNNKEIIKKTATYLNIFNQSKEVQATIVSDCSGLDSINSSGSAFENAVLKTTTLSGDPIGAVIDETLLDVGVDTMLSKENNSTTGLQHKKYMEIIHWQNNSTNANAMILEPYNGDNSTSIAYLIHNKTGIDVSEAEHLVATGGVIETSDSSELVKELNDYGIKATTI